LSEYLRNVAQHPIIQGTTHLQEPNPYKEVETEYPGCNLIVFSVTQNSDSTNNLHILLHLTLQNGKSRWCH